MLHLLQFAEVFQGVLTEAWTCSREERYGAIGRNGRVRGEITFTEYHKLVKAYPSMISNMTLDIESKLKEAWPIHLRFSASQSAPHYLQNTWKPCWAT